MVEFFSFVARLRRESAISISLHTAAAFSELFCRPGQMAPDLTMRPLLNSFAWTRKSSKSPPKRSQSYANMNRIQVNYQQNMLRVEDMKSTKTCAGNVKTLEGWRRGQCVSFQVVERQHKRWQAGKGWISTFTYQVFQKGEYVWGRKDVGWGALVKGWDLEGSSQQPLSLS